MAVRPQSTPPGAPYKGSPGDKVCPTGEMTTGLVHTVGASCAHCSHVACVLAFVILSFALIFWGGVAGTGACRGRMREAGLLLASP